jgi:ABC-type nitrate/sulfonate/bicarbonate transport system permease component
VRSKGAISEVLSVRSLAAALLRVALAIAGLALLIGLWAVVASFSNPARLPSPGTVWSTLRADWKTVAPLQYIAFQSGGIAAAVRYTTINVIVGVTIGSLAGFVVGAWLGRVRLARELMEIPMLVLGTFPLLVLLPFLLIWFGTARFVQSALVILFAFITVTGVVQQAALSVGARYTDYAASLGAQRRHVLFQVVVPAVLPPTIGAIRVTAALGWSFATASELLGGQNGTGKLIQALEGIQATPDIMAAVVAVGIAALLLDSVIVIVGGWVVGWNE